MLKPDTFCNPNPEVLKTRGFGAIVFFGTTTQGSEPFELPGPRARKGLGFRV